MTFKVLVNGENYQMEVDGELQLLGFFATRFIHADSREEAGRLALTSIESDLAEQIPGTSTLKIVSIDQIETISELPQPSGFSFYRMDDKS